MSLPLQLLRGSAVALVFFWLGRATRRQRQASPGVFVLSMRVALQSQEEMEALEALFAPLATYVRTSEPTTLSYEMSRSDGRPFELLVHERYTSRETFEGVHRKSEPFLTFKKKVAELPFPVVFDGMSYVESGMGFN